MVIVYSIFFFLLGLVCGSFYTTIGYRLPKKESVLVPTFHCTMCNHKLSILEFIPVFSFLAQKGRCRYCKGKISWYYLVFELLTGFLFLLSYIKFGLTFSCFLAITLSSIFIMIVISDYKYYIIPDQLLVIGVVFISISKFLIGGGPVSAFDVKGAFLTLGLSLVEGVLSFLLMYGVKKFGDFLFQKESMGGGDIKLLFMIGMTLGFPLSIICIFVASLIGFPVALILLQVNSNHVIPFGPFLSVATMLLFFLELTWKDIIHIVIW